MNQPNEPSSKPSPSSSPAAASAGGGMWKFGVLAVVLFVGAVLAAAWLGARRGQPPAASQTASPAGTYDLDKARLETKDLQARVMQVMGRRDQTSSMIPDAEALVASWPSFAPAHTLLAQLYMNDGRFEQAHAHLEKSLLLDSQQPRVHELAGTVAQGLGKYEEAASHFAQLVGMEPDNTKHRVILAQAQLEMRDYEKARMTLLAALKIDANLHEAYYALSSIDARQGRLDQAITQASRAIELLPEDRTQGPRAAYVRWLSNLLRRDNRPADALAVFDNLTADQRQQPPVLEDIAICWQMLGKPAQGAELYALALSRKPDQAPLALGAARWYLKAGDRDHARRMIDALRRINPAAPALKELTEQLHAMPMATPAPSE